MLRASSVWQQREGCRPPRRRRWTCAVAAVLAWSAALSCHWRSLAARRVRSCDSSRSSSASALDLACKRPVTIRGLICLDSAPHRRGTSCAKTNSQCRWKSQAPFTGWCWNGRVLEAWQIKGYALTFTLAASERASSSSEAATLRSASPSAQAVLAASSTRASAACCAALSVSAAALLAQRACSASAAALASATSLSALCNASCAATGVLCHELPCHPFSILMSVTSHCA